jgi:hypothetical protein
LCEGCGGSRWCSHCLAEMTTIEAVAAWLEREAEVWARNVGTDNGAREQVCLDLAERLRRGGVEAVGRQK